MTFNIKFWPLDYNAAKSHDFPRERIKVLGNKTASQNPRVTLVVGREMIKHFSIPLPIPLSYLLAESMFWNRIKRSEVEM